MALVLRRLIQTPTLTRGYPLIVAKEKIDEKSHSKTRVQRKIIAVPNAQYGGRHGVTMLPGGGIGPEMMHYVRQVFRFIGAPVDFEVIDIDPNVEGNDDLDYAITSIKRNGVALKGNIETKSEAADEVSRNVAIRNELDLYVNVIHCRSVAGIPSRHQNVDIVLVRQNTDGEYAMLEHESVHGVVESLKICTVENAERVARFAFEFAKTNGRKKVTTIHKANIMKLSDGLFLECAKKVAKDYPNIEHNNMIIDNTCMQLVSNPHQFDVMNLTNLYGTIVSNVICGLIGGAGLLSGRNYGDHYAVFEPGTRNTGTAIAGKNIANPVAMLNASVDMLYHLGHDVYARVIREAIYHTLIVDKIHTKDLGGTASSTDVVNNILKILSEKKLHCAKMYL
ncbi:isocitrate dehydrogenase [NAD] subunit gamma, mitochondrial isoform X2 [Condylostylus longicornis]|uniref:isocitrate dehydrogenase [NAD] subunit gamma, mitochondrial isoform X2 n=1 Tax=Condylostylus longicornis TaxID=2530218 RepID=UPI00244DADB0|nr:isocitrate dehydrogenase [NAD] subunit gamma, mitochondrial isoform X2 [Condylostylus longicornis]